MKDQLVLSVVPGSATCASLGTWAEMQSLRPYLGRAESESAF